MSWVRRLWFAAALVGILGAVAVFLGAVYGGAGLSVASMNVTGDTPTNQSANCEETVIRTVEVTVTISRRGIQPQNPQWWEVGVRIRATVFETAKQRTMSIAPGGQRSVTLPFTQVQERQWAPHEEATAVVQVTKGQAEIARDTLTATFRPVNAGRDC